MDIIKICQYSPNKISINPNEKIKEDKSNISFISKKSSFNKLNLINQNKKVNFKLP